MQITFNSPYQMLLGPAGSGKTTYIQSLSRALITSSTGVSAINAGGTTIHAALQFFDTTSLLRSASSGALATKLRAISNLFDTLVIDEISMLHGPQLTIIHHVMEKSNINMNLLLVGDFCQLPLVPDKKVTSTAVYQTDCLQSFDIQYLREVRRQSDPGFIQALTSVREGRPHEAVDWFMDNVEFVNQIDDNYAGTTILTTNDSVDRYNAVHLAQLEGPSRLYTKNYVIPKGGRAAPEWGQIPESVELRKGARVILLRNRLPTYANGDIAVVEELMTNTILVTVERTGQETIIEYVTRDNKELGTNKLLGRCHYLPVRLGYALTVHRSQGLTLNNVQARLSNLRWLSGGLYTILSRVRHYSGLRLIGTRSTFCDSCYIEPSILKFYNQLGTKS